MTKIFKYPIHKYPSQSEPKISMPKGSLVVHVGFDPNQQVCIWAQVDPNAPMEEVSIQVVGTGHECPEGHYHIGSFLDGPFVWHVFKERP